MPFATWVSGSAILVAAALPLSGALVAPSATAPNMMESTASQFSNLAPKSERTLVANNRGANKKTKKAKKAKKARVAKKKAANMRERGAMVTPLLEQSPADVSGWEWRRLDQHSADSLTAELVDFRNRYSGSRIVVDLTHLVDISEIADPTARAEANSSLKANLEDYLTHARDAGYREAAIVVGTPSWARPEAHYVTGIVARWVRDYNANASPAALLVTDIEWDVEPWGTPEWREGDSGVRRAMAVEWLAFLDEAARAQENLSAATPVAMGVDIPYWFDGTGVPKTVVFQGVRTTPTAHVFRVLDNGATGNTVTVMAYRDTPYGRGGSILALAAEFTLADSHAGRVGIRIGQDVSPPMNDEPETSTFNEEGFEALGDAMRALETEYSGRAGYRGFAINHLSSLV